MWPMAIIEPREALPFWSKLSAISYKLFPAIAQMPVR